MNALEELKRAVAAFQEAADAYISAMERHTDYMEKANRQIGIIAEGLRKTAETLAGIRKEAQP